MKRVTIFVFIVMSLIDCIGKNRQRSEPEELRLFKEKAVVLPENLLAANRDEQMPIDTTLLNRPYKLIVYVNQAECLECQLKALVPIYLFKLEYEYLEDVGVIFILNTSNVEATNRVLTNVRFFRTVFYDLNNDFERLNPHLPKNAWFHTFLLNEKTKSYWQEILHTTMI